MPRTAINAYAVIASTDAWEMVCKRFPLEPSAQRYRDAMQQVRDTRWALKPNDVQVIYRVEEVEVESLDGSVQLWIQRNGYRRAWVMERVVRKFHLTARGLAGYIRWRNQEIEVTYNPARDLWTQVGEE